MSSWLEWGEMTSLLHLNDFRSFWQHHFRVVTWLFGQSLCLYDFSCLFGGFLSLCTAAALALGEKRARHSVTTLGCAEERWCRKWADVNVVCALPACNINFSLPTKDFVVNEKCVLTVPGEPQNMSVRWWP